MCKFGVSAPWYESDQTAFNLYAMECKDETPDDDDADCFCDDWDENVDD